MITPEDFKVEMKKIARKLHHDKEVMHVEMDDLMCKVLKELGYNEGVKIFSKQEKWYA